MCQQKDNECQGKNKNTEGSDVSAGVKKSSASSSEFEMGESGEAV